METILASAFGIKPNQDISQALEKALLHLKTIPGEKTLVFEPGTYTLSAALCKKHLLYITNTAGDEEYKEDETPHLAAVGFYLGGMEDLTIDGGGAIFMIDGKMTPFALEDCRNITLKNFEIRHRHPDMHEFRVCGVNLFSVDFELDSDSLYTVENGKLYFYGDDYRVRADKDANTAFWIGRIRQNTPQQVRRTAHPLALSRRTEDRGNGRIRVHSLHTARFRPGDRYYVYDVRRQFVGIFINRCRDIQLKNLAQRFNYSLALVAQDSENLSLLRLTFAPEADAARKIASCADFMQFCMCRGQILVRDSLFDGAGDDCLNVHGIHFKITKAEGKKLTVRFMHPQTHGFNPLRVGDEIAFIHPETLLEFGRATIEETELAGEYEIRLRVDSAKDAIAGAVIEDITACPDLLFQNNTLTRIITRGLLITTRGQVVVENNRFVSTTMSGILLSDDAKSWYESGMCQNMTIRGNRFESCGEPPILILPENSRHAGAVHKNITISGNVFENVQKVAVSAKSTDSLTLENNRLEKGELLQTKNCTNLALR